jgi:hypothetical protein
MRERGCDNRAPVSEGVEGGPGEPVRTERGPCMRRPMLPRIAALAVGCTKRNISPTGSPRLRGARAGFKASTSTLVIE